MPSNELIREAAARAQNRPRGASKNSHYDDSVVLSKGDVLIVTLPGAL